MKSKRLVSTVLAATIICGGLLIPSSPLYTARNHNKGNIVQAMNSGKYINIEKRYNAKEVGENPTLAHMLKISKPASERMLNRVKGSKLINLLVSEVPHDNQFYYVKSEYEGRPVYSFTKILQYKASSKVRHDIMAEKYTVEFMDGKVIGNKVYNSALDFDQKAHDDMIKLHDYTEREAEGITSFGKEVLPDLKPSTPVKPPAGDPSKPDRPDQGQAGQETNPVKSMSRLSGRDRYKTNTAITKRWNKSDTIVVCNGTNFPDALSASPLAKKYNAPLMLVDGNKLTSEQESEIARLGVKKAYIIGSEGVMKNTIVSQLKNRGVTSTTRLGGRDRYDTCKKIADQIGYSNGVVVVNGTGFADALSVAPIAAKKQMPILLVQKDTIPSSIKGLLSKVPSNKQNYVIGSTGVVADSIRSQFNAVRVGGHDRYDTNYQVLNYFKDCTDFKNVYVANGSNFPDALSVTALAAKENAPLVISSSHINKDTVKLAKSKGINKLALIGGDCVTSDLLKNEFKSQK